MIKCRGIETKIPETIGTETGIGTESVAVGLPPADTTKTMKKITIEEAAEITLEAAETMTTTTIIMSEIVTEANEIVGTRTRGAKKETEIIETEREKDPTSQELETREIGTETATAKGTETETETETEKASSAESKIPPCPHQAIIDIYHQTLPELPKVISWNKTREAHLKQRWRELFTEFECKSTEEGLDWFRNDFFQFIKNSKFLTGRTQSKDRRPFLADLEWVIKPTNFTKIIERKYL